MAVAGGVTYYVVKNKPAPEKSENRLPREESEFRAKLAEFRMQKEKISRGTSRLERQKKDALDRIKAKGVKSSADIDPNDNEVQYALRNLKEIKAQIDELQSDIQSYDEAISGLDSMLVKIETRNIEEASKISEDEYFFFLQS